MVFFSTLCQQTITAWKKERSLVSLANKGVGIEREGDIFFSQFFNLIFAQAPGMQACVRACVRTGLK